MKVSQINVQSVLGAKDVHIQTNAPVIVIAGDNFSGKSSTKEAIYQAVANQATRTELKKDFGELVSDGNKKGSASIYFEGGSGSIALPKGSHAFSFEGVSQAGAELMQMAMPYCLDGVKLADVSIDDRRKFLMKLMNVRTGIKDVLARLIEEGADQRKSNEIVALLHAGFPTAVTEAETKAREQKALWKALTRENWGSEKSDDWKLEYAASPEVAKIDIKSVEAEIEAQTKEVDSLTGELATLRAEQKTYADIEQKRTSFESFAATLPFAEEALTQDIAAHTEFEKEVVSKRVLASGESATITFTCPCCAVLLERVGDNLVEYSPPDQIADEAAKAELPAMEAKLKALARSVETSKGAVESAKNARASLGALPEKSGADYSNSIKGKLAEIEAAKLALNAANSTKNLFDTNKTAKADAEKKTADAKAIHDHVTDYLKIAKLLSPTGIPSKLLADAIAPFNQALAASAEMSYWSPVSVDSDMNVLYGSRNYHLCSESEQWRCNAMLSEVIAKFSQLRFIMLDRFDCLNAEGRSDMVAWLEEITSSGTIETAIVFGTMKDKPVLPSTCQLTWMNNGVSEDWKYLTNTGGAPRWELQERVADEHADDDRIAA